MCAKQASSHVCKQASSHHILDVPHCALDAMRAHNNRRRKSEKRAGPAQNDHRENPNCCVAHLRNTAVWVFYLKKKEYLFGFSI